jgi:hypothetical protein
LNPAAFEPELLPDDLAAEDCDADSITGDEDFFGDFRIFPV